MEWVQWVTGWAVTALTYGAGALLGVALLAHVASRAITARTMRRHRRPDRIDVDFRKIERWR